MRSATGSPQVGRHRTGLVGPSGQGGTPPRSRARNVQAFYRARRINGSRESHTRRGLAGTWWNILVGTVLSCALLLTQVQTALAQQQHVIPLLPPASTSSHQGFVRLINHSEREGRIRILAVDDSGSRFGPVFLYLGAKESVHFTSRDLERGNVSKGLPGGVGNGQGNWRLELETTLDIEPLALVRVAGGFLTSIHDLIPESNTCHHVPVFNPGSNLSARSQLRLFNPGSHNVDVTIRGRDDRGEPPPAGEIRLTLPAGSSRTITARQLESGGNHFSGSFGDGSGKWQLFVSAWSPVRVMSLLWSPTGHLTNLSTSPIRTSGPVDWRCGGEKAESADLMVESVSVSDDTLTVHQPLTVHATVYNSGAVTSSPTEVHAYVHEGAYRNPLGASRAVPALSPLERRRISMFTQTRGGIPTREPITLGSGTNDIFACVDTRSGTEHCSDAIRVTVHDEPRGPDLAFGRFVLEPREYTVGEYMRIGDVVVNQGNVVSSPTTVRLYRSTDDRIDWSDHELDSRSLPGFEPNNYPEYMEFSVRLTSAGRYSFGFCVEPVPEETNFDNNCWKSGTVWVVDG